jgi:gamma-glutamyl phosphate reductase
LSTPVTATSLAATVAAMKRAHIQDGPASAELRQDRLSRAMTLLSTHHRELVDAVNADFGHRAAYQTLAADIMSSLGALRHAREQLTQWMQPEEQPAPAPGMQARIQYQPLGVVGIISPWNFPINLAFSPLAGVLAAGNRALIKPSELTPRTSALMGELIARYFDPMEIGTVLGDASVGAAFSGQAFDHLIFTGGTNVGRQVMRAAAENLVPVTLELGGKSPVLVDTDADLQTAAERILTVKTFNAGQICIAPDYVLLPASAQDAFVTHARAFVSRVFPALHTNPDYTAIISERHFQRLQALLDDARAQGATVVELQPAGEPLAGRHHPQDGPDPGVGRHRRHARDAGRDLRPHPAAQNLHPARRGPGLHQRPSAPAGRLLLRPRRRAPAALCRPHHLRRAGGQRRHDPRLHRERALWRRRPLRHRRVPWPPRLPALQPRQGRGGAKPGRRIQPAPARPLRRRPGPHRKNAGRVR